MTMQSNATTRLMAAVEDEAPKSSRKRIAEFKAGLPSGFKMEKPVGGVTTFQYNAKDINSVAKALTSLAKSLDSMGVTAEGKFVENEDIKSIKVTTIANKSPSIGQNYFVRVELEVKSLNPLK
jgi:hypothetical protein